jgi:hypothetical protein
MDPTETARTYISDANMMCMAYKIMKELNQPEKEVKPDYIPANLVKIL